MTTVVDCLSLIKTYCKDLQALCLRLSSPDDLTREQVSSELDRLADTAHDLREKLEALDFSASDTALVKLFSVVLTQVEGVGTGVAEHVLSWDDFCSLFDGIVNGSAKNCYLEADRLEKMARHYAQQQSQSAQDDNTATVVKSSLVLKDFKDLKRLIQPTPATAAVHIDRDVDSYNGTSLHDLKVMQNRTILEIQKAKNKITSGAVFMTLAENCAVIPQLRNTKSYAESVLRENSAHQQLIGRSEIGYLVVNHQYLLMFNHQAVLNHWGSVEEAPSPEDVARTKEHRALVRDLKAEKTAALTTIAELEEALKESEQKLVDKTTKNKAINDAKTTYERSLMQVSDIAARLKQAEDQLDRKKVSPADELAAKDKVEDLTKQLVAERKRNQKALDALKASLPPGFWAKHTNLNVQVKAVNQRLSEVEEQLTRYNQAAIIKRAAAPDRASDEEVGYRLAQDVLDRINSRSAETLVLVSPKQRTLPVVAAKDEPHIVCFWVATEHAKNLLLGSFALSSTRYGVTDWDFINVR